jgi:hypothetical protein
MDKERSLRKEKTGFGRSDGVEVIRHEQRDPAFLLLIAEILKKFTKILRSRSED